MLRPGEAAVMASMLFFGASCSCGYNAHQSVGADTGTADAAIDAHGDAARDSNVDASHDASRDSSIDAARDAAIDAHTTDPDAEFLGCDPGWRPVPSIPDGLEVLYAENPGCLLNVEWVSCGIGCLRLIEDARFQRAVDDGWSDNDLGFFSIVEGIKDRRAVHNGRIKVIASTDGRVHAAFLDNVGGVGGHSLTDGFLVAVGRSGGNHGSVGFSIFAGRTDGHGGFVTFHHLIYQTPLAALRSPIEPMVRLDPPDVPVGNGLQFVHASATTFTAEVQPLAKMLVVEGTRWRWLGGRGSATPYVPQESVLVGHQVFWLDWAEGSKVRIAHGNMETDGEVFRELPDGDILGLASDGQDLAWVQAYEPDVLGNSYARMELWTAPYTADAASLRPRLVTTHYHGNNGGVLRNHHYVSFGQERDSLEYSLDDGSERRWDNPVGALVGPTVLWLGLDEVAYDGVLPSDPGQGTVVRLSIADAYHAVP